MLERQNGLGARKQFHCPRKRQRNTLQRADPFDGAKSTSLFSNNSQISTTLPPRGAKTSLTAANMHTLPATRKTQTTTPAISFAASGPHTFPATRLDPKKPWQSIFLQNTGLFLHNYQHKCTLGEQTTHSLCVFWNLQTYPHPLHKCTGSPFTVCTGP
jgi:hypothetical protein